jgi:beta-glucosidase
MENNLMSKLSFEEKSKMLTGYSSMQTYEIKDQDIISRNFADGPHGVRASKEDNCTHFPRLCNLGSSWSKETAYLMGKFLAKDCIKHNINMLLGPGVNIKRHILCGRNFEYFSEDPVLSGELAAGYINGLQEMGVHACIKHFAVNNQECDRLYTSADIEERTLREIYLKPFEIAVKKSNPSSVMCAYNKVNGIWCSENKYLLNDILKEEWGFKGFVVSDWGAVQNINRAISAGLDLQMPENPHIFEELTNGLKNQQVQIEEIDNAVSRILNFVNSNFKTEVDYDRNEQHKIAQTIASDGMVLLKNQNHTLPITTEKYKKIAVVGEYAVSPLIAGQGSAMVYQAEGYTDNILDELKKRLPSVDIKYFEGYKKRELPNDMIWPKCWSIMEEMSDRDLIIFFAGAMESEDTENFDRRTAYLNPNIEFFIDTASKLNKPIVVVLQNGGALILGKWEKEVDSILEMWLAGEAAGGAVADILCGIKNPSGKLSETFPNKMRTDLEYPGDGYKVEYKERFDVGYRYYDKHPEEILYPFGHGLSYTDFEYSNLSVYREENNIIVCFDLTNVGDIKGEEVVQLYIGDPISTVVKPLKELKQFQKISLEPMETKKIYFCLNQDDYSYYNVMLQKYVVEAGRYNIYIGSSSQDIRLTSFFIQEEDDSPYSINCIGETMVG